ncbi:MAG TPA: methylated-DNA--[protein]-cysteine S-methyltransferase [Alphaproteobacteria bacterium]|nr:methylated-DNA--[protein]-cysteine S-methyltransferase [Alphaproteobacteria bacterium]
MLKKSLRSAPQKTSKDFTNFDILGSFSKVFSSPLKKSSPDLKFLSACKINTPLGSMIALSDERGLYLLEFVDKKGLEDEIEKLTLQLGACLSFKSVSPLFLIKQELEAYFEGKLTTFVTPLHLLGSEFRKSAWTQLLLIPYGKTHSYATQALLLQKPTAYRAVANANGANRLAIIVPCHRVIRENGELGGYAGGVNRKEWLLAHEKKHSN